MKNLFLTGLFLLLGLSAWASGGWWVERLSGGGPVAGPFTFKSDCDDAAAYFEKADGHFYTCRYH